MKKILIIAGAVILIAVTGREFLIYQKFKNCPERPSGSLNRGAPAAPDIFEVFQPDGSKINIRNIGDGRINFTETSDGYSIEKATDGFWYYVSDSHVSESPITSDNTNGFYLTNVRANLPPPSNIDKGILPPCSLSMWDRYLGFK